MTHPLITRARNWYAEPVNGPATHEFPTMLATITAELRDAAGSGRRSRGEAAIVSLLGLSVILVSVFVAALAIVG